MARWGSAAFVAAMLLLASSVHATSPKDPIEASMLLSGTVEVLPDGKVGSYALYKAEKLPPAVLDLIKRVAPTWKFELGEAHTAPFQERMSLRIVATNADDRHMTLRVASADFSDKDEAEGATITWARRVPPVYPSLSRNNNVSGTVYLLVRVGQDGKVTDVSAEQVNLGVSVPSAARMAEFREDLAHAAIKASRYWKFQLPTSGNLVQAPYWDARIPVGFIMSSGSETPYGEWDVYVPGPREHIAWAEDSALVAEAPDAIPDGSIHLLGSGTHLISQTAPN
ncbi:MULTISPECIES: energy transducer TonB [unclassified Dyella]|uniref:energy transducer TonB n=1 Tax=unclassified Dyella TaxID=2634549 RepID=UPI003F929E11